MVDRSWLLFSREEAGTCYKFIVAKRINGAATARSAGAGGIDDPATLAQPRRRSLSSQPAPAPKRKRSFWRKLWIWTQVVMAVFIIAASIVAFFIYQQAQVYYQRAEKIDLNKLNDLNVTSTFLDVSGEELGRTFVEAEDRILLKPDQIPDLMRKAVMAAEDRRYYEHGAIDYWGILRAMRENFGKKGRVQGGSTIEQQLAKHLIGDFSRTLDRKFLEAFVAVRLEQHYSKDEILNYYLNRIYFGQGYFGVGAAARGYFGKEAGNLSLPECAMLAGIIRAPVSSSPRKDLGKARLRRDQTLNQMEQEGYITQEEYSRAVGTPVRVIAAKRSGPQSFIMAAAVKELEQILAVEGTEEMPQGLTVRTNIDLRLQRALEEQMEAHLVQIETSGLPADANQPAAVAPVNPTMSPPPKQPLQGSAIVADLATGRVMAWIGGRDFLHNQFDHVSMARRENGALLQPVIYGMGFDKLNLSPATMVNASYIDPSVPASPADLALGNPNTDLTKRFLSIQDALALGNRAAATRVALQIGPRAVPPFLRRAGVDARIPTGKDNVFNPEPMTLGDIASLYQVLGNDGIHRKLKIIQSITSQDGQVLYDDSKADREEKNDQLLDIVNDEQLTLTMQNALRTGFARTLTRDYGLRAPIAGMPGYSEGYRDAWFVGYTPKLVAGVWVGYDDSRAIGSKDVAVKSAVPLWGDIMREVLARTNGGAAFPEPASLSKVEIDRSTGALRGLAGLAPAPEDIFVYLKKDQVDAATSQANTAQQLQAPHEWSDWLTTMFNDADETGLAPDQVTAGSQDKRDNIIPTLAEYKMPGLRGDIISSDGTVYATMQNQQNLVVKWPAAGDSTTDADIVAWMRARFDEANKTVGAMVTISDPELLAQYHTQRYQPFTVLEDITPTQADQIRNAGLEAKGFGFVGTPRRVYPRGAELAHVLGYLSRDQQRNRGKYLSGDVIYDRYKGAVNAGLEYKFDKDLAGTDGSFMISTTPDGYARSAAVSAPPGYGNTLRLTIDSKIQASAERALNRKRMDAWVMLDIHNGDVVAMASHPTFDPNIFLPTIAPDEWQLLNTDQYVPMLNRAIDAQFPPGSCFKTVTSVAAMVAGCFDPNWVVHCVGYYDLDNSHRMNLPEEHGDVTYKDALTHSFNTYFATLGAKVGRDVLLDTARSFNFGSKTGIDLPGELPGLIPDSEYVRRVHQRDFGSGDTVLTAIGQGDVLVTPIQMADFMAALANGGTVYRPRLVKEVDDHSGKKIRDIPTDIDRTVTLTSPFMANLKEGMINVVDEGTATVVHRSDMKIAAKTGTAQVGTKAKPRQVAWLCGYLPADNPQYSFAVMIQGEDSDNHGLGLDDGLLGGREGGEIASHIFDDIYGPPPNAKERSSNFEDYDKAPNLAPAQPVADNSDTSADSADKTATTNAAPVNPPVAKPADTADDDSDATGLGGGGASRASARASASTVVLHTSSKNP
jgi:penicillin-binding protein 2